MNFDVKNLVNGSFEAKKKLLDCIFIKVYLKKKYFC